MGQCNIGNIKSPGQRHVVFKTWQALGRLGHNLGIREDLPGFVVTAYTRDVLPWFIGYIAVGVIQRNDVLHRRQKLKFAL